MLPQGHVLGFMAMSSAVHQGLEYLGHLHGLAAHPLALVVGLALIAALVEQRLARRRTPDFSGAWRGIDRAPPKAPPPATPRDRG
jgi:hypothetical protein